MFYSNWRQEIIEQLGEIAAEDPAINQDGEMNPVNTNQDTIELKKVRNKIKIHPLTTVNENFNSWVNFLLDEGYDLSDYTWNELKKLYINEVFLVEKSVSKSQQKLFGLALAVKRGEVPRSEVSNDVLEIVDSMSETKIRDFAKTKHKGLPEQK